jgi:mannose-6-phosphate isomerase
MALLKLKPTFKDYLWGGHRLVDDYQKEYDGDILAESWELSCHPDGPCYITNGAHSGKTLRQFIESEGKAVLGTNCERFEDFPILAKFIDARDSLSIQVHPDDAYALKYEGQYGKTEMWYVMDCEPGAYLYYGFNREVSEEEFAERIQNETLEEVLNKVDVHKGDVLFIEARTLHAICKGILIAEIQQNSNLTYRIYDYGRVGADGKKRELHVDKALKVTDRFPVIKNLGAYPHVADCEYFTVDKLYLDGSVLGGVKGTVDASSFVSILFMEGEGQISCNGEVLSFRKGDSFLLTANSGDYEVIGKCEALVTRIREQK